MVEPMGFLGSSKASLSIVEAVANTASPQLHTEDLETGLLQDGVMKFANPLTTSWSCIDGRASEPVFGYAHAPWLDARRCDAFCIDSQVHTLPFIVPLVVMLVNLSPPCTLPSTVQVSIFV